MKKIVKLIPLVAASLIVSSISLAQDKKVTSRDTMEKIASQGVIVLAVRESSVPFAYFDAKGNTIGYTVEICERIAKKIRKNLNLSSLKVVYLPVQANERMDVVKNGLADMECGTTTITRERQRNVDFSVAVFAGETRFIASKDFTFKDVSELNGKQISVTSNSTGESYVNDEKKKRNLTYQVNQYRDTTEGVLSVLEGTNQVNANNDILLYSQMAFNPAMKEKLHLTGNSFSPSTYGIVLPKGDTKFKNEVDNILKNLMSSGEINKIYEKWFLNTIPPKNININFPMSDITKAIFEKPTDAALIDK